MSTTPLRRIYFDSNPLHGWPKTPYGFPWMVGLAMWNKGELFVPQTVEDELEAQFIRGGAQALKAVSSAFRELRVHCHGVIDFQYPMPEATDDELSESYLSHSATARSHFSMQLIPQVDVPLDKLLRMAICRQPPFEEKTSGKDSRFVTGLQDTAILFSIIEHAKMSKEGERCAFVSADAIFHTAEVKKLLATEAPNLEVFKSVESVADDLWGFVFGVLRSSWEAEMKQVEDSLNAQKEQLAEQISPLLPISDLGRGSYKNVRAILSMSIKDFSLVKTELPPSEQRPPSALEYHRPDGSSVEISAQASIDFRVMAESYNLFASFLLAGQDYTPDPAPPKLEETTIWDRLKVSLIGTVMGGVVGEFQVTSVEVAK
jgi:hypothetical protein